MTGYMFDTNVFNDIVDSNIDISSLADGPTLYATHIQVDEIRKTPDEERRVRLEELFSEIPQESVPTESMIWDVSRWGKSKWSDGELLSGIRQRLVGFGGRDESNDEDALLADIAINKGFILVTHDRCLYRVVTEFGGAACNLEHLLVLAQKDA